MYGMWWANVVGMHPNWRGGDAECVCCFHLDLGDDDGAVGEGDGGERPHDVEDLGGGVLPETRVVQNRTRGVVGACTHARAATSASER